MKLVKDRFDWSSGWRGEFEVEYGIDVVATNDTDHIIELVKTSSLILSADGVAVGGAGGYWYEENVYMDPSESSTFSVATSNIFRSLLGDNVQNVSAHVDVTFFTKEFAVLGEFSVPEADGDASVVTAYSTPSKMPKNQRLLLGRVNLEPSLLQQTWRVEEPILN